MPTRQELAAPIAEDAGAQRQPERHGDRQKSRRPRARRRGRSARRPAPLSGRRSSGGHRRRPRRRVRRGGALDDDEVALAVLALHDDRRGDGLDAPVACGRVQASSATTAKSDHVANIVTQILRISVSWLDSRHDCRRGGSDDLADARAGGRGGCARVRPAIAAVPVSMVTANAAASAKISRRLGVVCRWSAPTERPRWFLSVAVRGLL